MVVVKRKKSNETVGNVTPSTENLVIMMPSGLGVLPSVSLMPKHG